MLQGRTAGQAYEDLMSAFITEFRDLLGVCIQEVVVGKLFLIAYCLCCAIWSNPSIDCIIVLEIAILFHTLKVYDVDCALSYRLCGNTHLTPYISIHWIWDV